MENYILNNNDIDLAYNYEIILSDTNITNGKVIECILVKRNADNEMIIQQCRWLTDFKGVIIEDNYIKLKLNDIKRQSFHIYAVVDNYIVSTRLINISEEAVYKYNVIFIKNDNIYQGENFKWSTWTYSRDREGIDEGFQKQTDLGMITSTNMNNIIVRKEAWGDNWYNPWEEQTTAFRLENKNNPYYIIYGEDGIRSSLKDVIMAIKPKIYGAIMDCKDTIYAHLSHEVSSDVEFTLLVNGKKVNDINIEIDNKELVIRNICYDIKPRDLVEIKANKIYRKCSVLKRLILNDYYYEGHLGISFTESDISFKLWAPSAFKVELLIYENYNSNKENPCNTYEMSFNEDYGLYSIEINKLQNEGKYYLYRLYFISNINNGDYEYKITYAIDPYAMASSINGEKGAIININDNKTKPQYWESDIKPELPNKEDSIIYELHVRDFSIDNTSKVKCENKGKFLGITEENTTFNTVSTSLNHLKELGITHVHLLPVFDFDSVDESNNDASNRNWGYDPQNYNVVEGSYSTCAYNPIIRIKEFRELIYKLHKNGIRVVIDVVYNHMASTQNFDNIVPGYYFRTDNYGRFTNGSGCGNEMATENLMVRKFIIDSCIHWIKNYHIDGLRFDLMELIDVETINSLVKEVNSIDEAALIYGEPWKGGDSPLKNGISRGIQQNKGFSIFNDIYRDSIRGDNQPSNGYVNGKFFDKDISWNILEGIQGSINTLTANPSETINYIDAHDNLTIFDHILISQKCYDIQEIIKNIHSDVLNNTYIKQVLLAFGFILFSQGIPFICGGSEFLRSKNGDHNSYKSSDSINSFKWDFKDKYYDVFEAVRIMIKIRKTYNCFRMKSSEDIRSRLTLKFHNNDDQSGVIICSFNNEEQKNVIVVFNATYFDNYYIGDFCTELKDSTWRLIFNNYKEVNHILNYENYEELTSIGSYSINVYVQQ